MSEIQHNLTQLPVDQLLQLKAVVPLVNMSESHLRTLIASGRIAGIKLGTTWFTTRAAVDAYLAIEHKPGRKPKYQTAMK